MNTNNTSQIARQMVNAPSKKNTAAPPAAEPQGLGGPLGIVFSSVEFFSVSGAKEVAEKDNDGKLTGDTSRMIGGMVGILHVSGWKIGPFNMKLVTHEDGGQEIRATFPAASGRAWAGAFLELGQRTPEAGQLRDAIKAQIVAGFLSWRREIMSRPVEQRPAVRQAPQPKPVRTLSAEELAELGL